jgi:hypothetical protein
MGQAYTENPVGRGGIALPDVLVPLRNKLIADADSLNVLEGHTKHPWWLGCGGPPESSGRGMQKERRWRTREAPKAPGRGEAMKPTGLGHERVMSPDTACARVASSSMERPGRPATAVCQGGVLSGLVVGDGESPLPGEGPDGSTPPAKETRAGQAGSDQHEPTSLRGIANRAKESKHHRYRPERGLRPPSASPPRPPGCASADRGAPSRAECGPGPCRTSGWCPRRRPDNP